MNALTGWITDVPGLKVGHYTDRRGVTGCTVVLCEEGAAAAVDLRGGAPATRETDLLRPDALVQQVYAIVLTGGSAFGLAAADGVIAYLEQRRIGFATSAGPVPIVPAAALFDLALGDAAVRPGPEAGRRACEAAAAAPVPEGSVGAGTGATVGHLRGRAGATKGGLGTASRRLGAGCTVGALVAVNALGDVVDPSTGTVLAGARSEDGRSFVGPAAYAPRLAERPRRYGEHTTLAVVATDAALDRAALGRVAAMAHDGLARAINPVHTSFDGDVVFALSSRLAPAVEPSAVGIVAADVLAQAVVRAVRAAEGLGGVPSLGDLGP